MRLHVLSLSILCLTPRVSPLGLSLQQDSWTSLQPGGRLPRVKNEASRSLEGWVQN